MTGGDVGDADAPADDGLDGGEGSGISSSLNDGDFARLIVLTSFEEMVPLIEG